MKWAATIAHGLDPVARPAVMAKELLPDLERGYLPSKDGPLTSCFELRGYGVRTGAIGTMGRQLIRQWTLAAIVAGGTRS